MILSIDIGGTTIQFAHLDDHNNILKTWTHKTPEVETHTEFYDFIYLKSRLNDKLKGVGVSVPGIVQKNGTITTKASKRLHCLYKTNLYVELNKRFDLPITALNDGKCAALCELILGNAKNTNSSIAFIIGTGIGGGLTYKNQVLFGKDSYAGEFSSIPLLINSKEVLLTSVASASALVNQYNKLAAKNARNSKDIFDLAKNNNLAAEKAISTWVTYIAYGLKQLTTIFNPDVILIGGGVTNNESLMPLIRNAYKTVMSDLNEFGHVTTKIDLCAYHNMAGIMGAYLYFKEQYTK